MKALCGILCGFLMLHCSGVTGQSKQEKKQSNTFYFALGTNWSFYSKSDIKLKSTVYPGFDFMLKQVRGKDDGGLNFKNGAPQYSYQLGYYNQKKNWGVEFNFDHIKYYVRQNQRVFMSGTINNQSYATDTLITPEFIKLEHSDGGNYALVKLLKELPLLQDKKGEEPLHLLLKAGAGPVIPKTNTTIIGKHSDDRYKISGYVLAIEGGLRYNFSKLLYAEANTKGAYAHYNHFLIADGKGSQRWFGLHFVLLAGLQLSKSL